MPLNFCCYQLYFCSFLSVVFRHAERKTTDRGKNTFRSRGYHCVWASKSFDQRCGTLGAGDDFPEAIWMIHTIDKCVGNCLVMGRRDHQFHHVRLGRAKPRVGILGHYSTFRFLQL
jgi:hypothetical protein